MGRLYVALLAAFAACCFSAQEAHAQLFSPGELSKVHSKLEGDDKCLDCHSSGRKIETALCTKCHAEIGTQLAHRDGLHGREYGSKPCAQCHVEHRGAAHQLVRWPGGARERFDHGSTGFALQGAHRGQDCDECHTQHNERGVRTFLKADAACVSCHKDPHDKRFGNECRACHNEVRWTDVTLKQFDHDHARFKLEGKHQQVKCESCHGTPPKYRGLQFASCTSCHTDPHAGRLGANCASCHSEQGWNDLGMQRSSHPGLSILGGHARVSCNSCHDRGLDSAPSKGARCVSCHQPVHEARFGTHCEDCHKRIQWLGLPEPLGRSVHSKTAFPLRGEHEEVACGRCHSPKLPAQARFRELSFDRCTGCHKDAHNREFSARDGGECAACHDEHGFRPTRFDPTSHADTAFPLEGRHMAVPCGSCHGNQKPRLNFKLEKKECAQCHQNPHGSQFAAEMSAGGCAHCHTPKDWQEPRIDHRTWPLTGAHGLAPCRACHEPTPEDSKAGRGASYRGVPRDCQGCHDDVHMGQFRLTQPLRTCEECHDTTQFELPRFEHLRLTGYPLEGAHELLSCARCHPSEKLKSGETATRFRLPYSRCADCHADPHGQAFR